MPKEKEDQWVAVAPEFGAGSEASVVVAPPVSAYQFFQREMTQVIKRELQQLSGNSSVDVGCLTKAVAEKWKNLPPAGRIRFENKAREDRTRYARESHARDVARLQRQEQLRREREVGILADGERRKRKTVLPTVDSTSRKETANRNTPASNSQKKKSSPDDDDDDSSFQKQHPSEDSSVDSSDYGSDDSDDDDDQQIEDSISNDSSDHEDTSDGDRGTSSRTTTKHQPRKSATTKHGKKKQSKQNNNNKNAETSTAKDAREQYVIDRQDKLRKERADQAKRRLEFLLKQSDIFSHFGGVQDEKTKLNSRTTQNTLLSSTTSTETDDQQQQLNDATIKPEQDHATLTCVHRESSSKERGIAIAEEEEQDLINPETTLATYLTSQPSDIGHGSMRDYQLEGLNWMIRLQENGVNGILAGPYTSVKE